MQYFFTQLSLKTKNQLATKKHQREYIPFYCSALPLLGTKNQRVRCLVIYYPYTIELKHQKWQKRRAARAAESTPAPRSRSCPAGLGLGG